MSDIYGKTLISVGLILVLAMAQQSVQSCSYNAAMCPNDAASRQIVDVENQTATSGGILTTSAGAPVDVMDALVTLNKRLIFNEYFMDSFTHAARERIPERIVHAKGGGAFGYFEVTHNITDVCNAKLFRGIGKRTPVAVRFSATFEQLGGNDTPRESRGFAVRFYTEHGNFDIAGLSTPMFFYKDPIFFVPFTHAHFRNPATNLKDVNMQWDFKTLRPETLLPFQFVFGDRGIPACYTHMPGFSIHTYQMINSKGETYFGRFHIHPNRGIKSLSSEDAMKIAGKDPDYFNRALYNDIAEENYPSWTVKLQVLSLKDVQTAGFDVFDVTIELPEDVYPLTTIGQLVLNRNPKNYFAEIEQLAFCPCNLVPYILGAPDKVFEARRFTYRDTQNYRLGVNFNKIPVNCPLSSVNTYNRDGTSPVLSNGGDGPNYYPNSYYAPTPVILNQPKLLDITQEPSDNFYQARKVYVEMNTDEKCRLIKNIVSSLGCATKSLQDRAVVLYKSIYPELGGRIQQALLSNDTITCAMPV